MQRTFTFHQTAPDQFFDWGILNKSLFKKIYELLNYIKRNPFEGKGKRNGNIYILSCKGHYQDK